MTIRGFRSLLDRDKHIYANKISLKDTTLIVDGDNFIIEFLSKLNNDEASINYRTKLYSSDLVSYGKALKEIGEKLKKCNIKPIFIFSGAIPNEKVVEKHDPIRIDCMFRSKSCLGNVNMDLERNKMAGSSACTILLKATSKTLIDDMGFERRRTPFFCHKYICKMSIEMKCPILSSDSDYILMESHEGFIMNSEIYDKKPVEVTDEAGEISGYALECSIYSRDNLLNHYPGLKAHMIPLFGAMLDSSYLTSKMIDHLFGPFKSMKPDAAGDQVDDLDNKNYQPFHKGIMNVFRYLSKFDDPKTALKSIISKIDSSLLMRDKMRKSDIYDKVNRRLKLWSLEDNSMIEATKSLERLYPDNGKDTHNFILESIRNDNISSKLTNIIFKCTQFERPYIEMSRWHSPNVLKKRIYSIVLALTRAKSLEKMSDEEKMIAANQDVCKIYDRISCGQLSFLCSVPLSNLNDDINLDEYDIERFADMKSDEALEVLLAAFYCSKEDWISLNKLTDLIFKDTFSYNAAICLVMFKYVAIESKMNIKNLVDAILLTLLYYAIENDEMHMIGKEIACKEELLKNLTALLDQVEDPVAKNKFPKEFYETTHIIALFNVALWGFINLNSILKCPMGNPRPELFMNGRMIYMFFRLSSSIPTQSGSFSAYPDSIKDNVENIKKKLSEFIPRVKRQVIEPLGERKENDDAESYLRNH